MKKWETSSGCQIIRILAGRSNVFLLMNGKKTILVDTSVELTWKTLTRRLSRLKVDHLDYLILTHSHMDHAGNAARVKEKYGPLVVIHRSESSQLSSGEFLVPAGTNFFSRGIVSAGTKMLPGLLRCEPCQPDILADSRFDLSEFGLNASLLHTPGHSPGSMSVIVDDEIALVGDAMVGLFNGTIFPPFAGDEKQVVKSWGRLLGTGCTLFIPSHGSANTRTVVQKNFDRRKE